MARYQIVFYDVIPTTECFSIICDYGKITFAPYSFNPPPSNACDPQDYMVSWYLVGDYESAVNSAFGNDPTIKAYAVSGAPSVFYFEFNSEIYPERLTSNTTGAVKLRQIHTTDFNILSVGIENQVASNPATDGYIKVLTSQAVKAVVSPVGVTASDDVEQTIPISRSITSLDIQLVGEQYTLASDYVTPLDYTPITNSLINIKIFPSIKAINVSVFANKSYGFQFSLDGVTYQDSNSFFGVALGSGTLYVKDDFGYVVTKTFVMSDYEKSFSVILPKDNSIRFKKIDKYLPSDDNLLSCEGLDEVNYKYVQRFDATDKIKIQIKAKYQPFMYADDEPIVMNKITSFMNTKVMMDISYNYVNVGNPYYEFYFIAGNYYDYDTKVDNGEDYELYGKLPEWIKLGGQFEISDDNFATSYNVYVNEIYYSVERKAYVIRWYSSTQVLSSSAKIRDTYELQPYEFYEGEIDMANYVNSDLFQVRISVFNDVDWVEFLSEYIMVGIEEGMKKIEYFNDKNTDMYYSDGIKNTQWAFINQSTATDEFNAENFIGDDNVFPIESSVLEVEKVIIDSPSKEVARSLVYALSLSNVYINNERVIAKDITLEQNNNTNLYNITATMYKLEEKSSNIDLGTNFDTDILTFVANIVSNGGKLYDMHCTNEFIKKLKNL